MRGLAHELPSTQETQHDAGGANGRNAPRLRKGLDHGVELRLGRGFVAAQIVEIERTLFKGVGDEIVELVGAVAWSKKLVVGSVSGNAVVTLRVDRAAVR